MWQVICDVNVGLVQSPLKIIQTIDVMHISLIVHSKLGTDRLMKDLLLDGLYLSNHASNIYTEVYALSNECCSAIKMVGDFSPELPFNQVIASISPMGI